MMSILLVIITLYITYDYRNIDKYFLRCRPIADEVITNTEYLNRFLMLNPRKKVLVYSDNNNFYFDLVFFVPKKNVYFSDQLRELPERTGLIFICRDNTPADILILSQTAFYNLGQFFLSGRTIYNVFYEK